MSVDKRDVVEKFFYEDEDFLNEGADDTIIGYQKFIDGIIIKEHGSQTEYCIERSYVEIGEERINVATKDVKPTEEPKKIIKESIGLDIPNVGSAPVGGKESKTFSTRPIDKNYDKKAKGISSFEDESLNRMF